MWNAFLRLFLFISSNAALENMVFFTEIDKMVDFEILQMIHLHPFDHTKKLHAPQNQRYTPNLL